MNLIKYKTILLYLGIPISKKKKESNWTYKRRNNGFKYVVEDYISREERHYCAYLFAWLLQDVKNVNFFLKSFSNEIINENEITSFDQVKLYYEFTWLRDIVYEFGRYKELKESIKGELKSELENFIFDSGGDIQKKKPDLAIYLKESKKLILIEAKFEEEFDDPQINETKKYGEALQFLVGKEIVKESIVTLLGRDYYLDKLIGIPGSDSEEIRNQKRKDFQYLSLAWETICSKLLPVDSVFKRELKNGLCNQYRIHPNTTGKNEIHCD